MDFLGFASWVEMLQLTLALFGATLGFWRLWIAIENGLLITDTDASDLRRVIAETQIIGELFKLFKQGLLVAIGVVSVLLPPPHYGLDEPMTETMQGFLVRIGLILLTLAMVGDSLVQEFRRQRFLSDVKAQRARPSTAAQSQEQMDRLHASIQLGTDAANEAYKEANSVNMKIQSLNARLLTQEQEAREEDKHGA